MAKIASKSFWYKYQERYQAIKSVLCVGLDSDFSQLPEGVKNSENPIWEFNKAIIEATLDYACAYKPNLAFYLADGIRGLDALYKTVEFIPDNLPVILDCKIGDIGNTMNAYLESFFTDLKVDAITLNPLMGSDVMHPVQDRNAFAFVLCLTSNPSASDFLQEGMAEKIANWLQDYPKENFGAVVGATHSANIKTMRNLLKDRILLIPGIGAQGGDLKTVLQEAKDSSETPNILVNSSRGIIFASKGKDFATAAREEARKLTQEMKNALSKG
ncbi:MAG TPA: orotidine-5'-phosphate decarboxylase [Candidatus Cloacimonas acidaminovorans]|nr:orotidine-5'-phosphate decarboxylase [Candidatus Cloacimonas acidaminovorans]HPX57527.1 orotidine-5'-phosphate decarboxylase [Candidatus Cloacimonas acidaminovorans]HQC07920.1 orotidine-5'-phosphate decarboxylase [Candidatus Cloacimonas acidaminovorans]